MRLLLVLSLLCLASACAIDREVANAPLAYPDSRPDSSIVDDYHGTLVADPYRWLEDDLSAATEAWVDEQNSLTEAQLSAIGFRQNIKSRLQRLYDFERYSTPEIVGSMIYYSKNTGLQNQSLLYREPLAGGEAELVLDPNQLSDDNTTSLSSTTINETGDYLAYQISEGGSDWKSVRVLDLKTLEPMADELSWVKFSGLAWLGDGFLYSRYPAVEESKSALSEANGKHMLYYHVLGTPQASDQLVWSSSDSSEAGARTNVSASVSDDEKWIIINRSQGTSGNSVALSRLKPTGKFEDLRELVSDYDHDYNFIHGKNDALYFWTNADAPNGRLIKMDVSQQPATISDVIAHDAARPLKSVAISGDKIYARYLENVQSKLEVYSLQGEPISDIELPGIGTASGISASAKGGPGFYSFSSFTDPGSIYRYNSDTRESAVWKRSDNGFDASLYETKQIRYRSKDGTEVPMFVVHRKGLDLDGQRPTLIYGYGGFDIAIEPRYAVMRLDLVSPLLEQGGVFALANIRGGSEFGSAWHEAGTKGQKQNVFDDFIAAAEYLQAEGYTSPARTAIYGRSNGGLLVGACMTLRPDLFGVAFPAVGVLDMLRYHKFTIGWAWASDYGRSDSTDAFKYLYAYSPLHNIRPVAYPATMITTADHDDRVVPAHSFKFAAALQAQQVGSAPILIRIDKSSGHGAGKPVDKQIDEATDLLSFMFHHMNIEYHQPEI